jgi:hypothetical protein
MAANFTGTRKPQQAKTSGTNQGFPSFCSARRRGNLKRMNQQQAKKPNQKDDRGRTQAPGGNPRQNDAVDHDLYNDENRPNLAQNKPRKP